MFNLVQVQQILQEKRQLLLHFEEITQQILLCPAEQLEEQVTERQKLIDLIDKLDERLAAFCRDGGEDGAALAALAKNEEIAAPPKGAEVLLHEIADIRTVLSRLKESDIQAALRLRVEQERIIEQIKETNQGVTAKAAKFYSSNSAHTGSSRFGNA